MDMLQKRISSGSPVFGGYYAYSERNINGVNESVVRKGSPIFDEFYGEDYTLGCVETGIFAFIPELINYYLVDGEIKFPHGKTQTGKFKCISEFHKMGLVEGEMKFPDGMILTGQFEYDWKRRAIKLIDG